MAELCRTLLLVAAVATLAGLLWPEQEGRYGKLIEFAIALLVLLALFRPLSGGLDVSQLFAGLRYPGNVYEEWDDSQETLAVAEKAVAEGIEADISSRYGIPASCIDATVTLSVVDGEMKIERLVLTFGGEGQLLDLYAVRAYAAQSYQTECEVKTNG